MRFEFVDMAVVLAIATVLSFVFVASWVAVELLFSRRYRGRFLQWMAFAVLFAASPHIQAALIGLFIR